MSDENKETTVRLVMLFCKYRRFFTILEGLILLGVGFLLIYPGFVVSSWNHVDGTILFSREEIIRPSVHSSNLVTYHPVIGYTYSVKDLTFYGITAHEFDTASQFESKTALFRFTPGTLVDLVVNPSNPNESKLQQTVYPPFSPLNLLIVFLGVLLIFFGIRLRPEPTNVG